MTIKTTASQKYSRLEKDRQGFLDRGRECAAVTVPSLLPPDGADGNTILPTPFQGLGARGVNSLSGKLLRTQFPPNTSFFKFEIIDPEIQKLIDQQGLKSKIDEDFARIEKQILAAFRAGTTRSVLHLTIRYLIAVGNALLFITPDNQLRVFRLDRYVVRRAPDGRVIEIIVKELVSHDMVPEDVLKHSDDQKLQNTDKDVEMFTHIYWDDDDSLYHIYQEIGGVQLDGSEGTYEPDLLPWLALRWSAVDGEDYGRGLAEEYLGDLQSYDGLAASILDGAAAAARIVVLVNPTGLTDPDQVASAENGDVIAGRADDVAMMQADKARDFSVVMQNIESLDRRLSMAFLLNTAIQRAGERVTAEEIRTMAQDLEDALGGTYSLMAMDLQLPIVRVFMDNLGLVMSNEQIKPTITTGLEALGRGHDLQKLDTFATVLQKVFGPEQAAIILNRGDFAKRVGVSLGIEMDGLVRSDEEIAAEQEQQMQQQMLMQATGPAVNQLGNVVKEGMKPNG